MHYSLFYANPHEFSPKINGIKMYDV